MTNLTNEVRQAVRWYLVFLSYGKLLQEDFHTHDIVSDESK